MKEHCGAGQARRGSVQLRCLCNAVRVRHRASIKCPSLRAEVVIPAVITQKSGNSKSPGLRSQPCAGRGKGNSFTSVLDTQKSAKPSEACLVQVPPQIDIHKIACALQCYAFLSLKAGPKRCSNFASTGAELEPCIRIVERCRRCRRRGSNAML